MTDTPIRLCGPDCPTPEEPHRDPEPDWIGDTPILHGESDHMVPGTDWLHPGISFPLNVEHYCLCGHPNYMSCPAPEGGIERMTIKRADGEAGR